VKRIWISCFLGLLLIGCNLQQKNRPPSFLKACGWATSNVHASFWTKYGDPAPQATAFRLFQVFVDDADGYQDVTSVKVIHPNGSSYWALEDDYNAEGGYWGGWYYWQSNSPHAVDLGTYTVLVRDSAGHEITDAITFALPGSTTGSGFIYSEDYKDSTSGGEWMIRRASVTSRAKGLADLTVSFTVSDSRVINGWVWLYDAAASYITWSGFFRDKVNNGNGLKVDGTTNTLQLAATGLELGTHAFADIAGFHLVLTDGAQYAPEVTQYDNRSVSAYVQF
jgi:hypothetical protein